MQYQEFFFLFRYLISRVFLAWTFLYFLAYYVHCRKYNFQNQNLSEIITTYCTHLGIDNWLDNEEDEDDEDDMDDSPNYVMN